ncbi:MAG: hypothetical protein IJV24_03270 [Prevotella sp.]|nr:hypothetical protein [Prevotella sp.]
MAAKSYKLPAVCWLRVTDFLHGWLQYELGGGVKIKEQRVVCVQHLKGARAILRMETADDMMEPGTAGYALSATRRNCIDAGMTVDAAVTERMYGIGREELQLFAPIECPRMALTEDGVLRPWTNDTRFGKQQATALQRLLREAFWQAVTDYAVQYAREHEGETYAQEDMIEAFCQETGTPDIHVPSIRREWQRRCKRGPK